MKTVMFDSGNGLPVLPSEIQSLAQRLFVTIGENPAREGLEKTPERFEKAILELTAGYRLTAEDAVGEGIFQSEGPGLIQVREIDFFSLCEHHILPFWGRVSVSYFPSDKILGLSKLARIVEVFSRRLQVQERLTREIAEAIQNLVQARAVFVRIQGEHMCMMMRGVRKVNSSTVTEFSIGLEDLSEIEKSRILASDSK